MGVPSFFRWLLEKYPRVIKYVKEEFVEYDDDGNRILPDSSGKNPNGVEYDNLYLDMNGIIHPCCHPESGPQPKNEDEMIQNTFKYIEHLFSMVRPRKLLYLAIDGVAPRSKMNQQRARRFRAAQERHELMSTRKKLESYYHKKGWDVPPPKPESWDHNVITPGTPFMDKLAQALRYWVSYKLHFDAGWKGIQVILSDANVPGEGEHKIAAFIRQIRTGTGYDPNTRHVLYGLDADLFMLGLATHEVYFTVLREEVLFGKNRPCAKCGIAGHWEDKCMNEAKPADADGGNKSLKPFVFADLCVLREYLEYELRLEELEWWDLERVIDDFVFLCFFVGNDFLPHLPSLEIREGAIDNLLKSYKLMLPKFGGFLTERGGKVNLRRVDQLLQEIASVETDVFKDRSRNEANYQRREQQKTERKRKEKILERRQKQAPNEPSSSDAIDSYYDEASSAARPALNERAQIGDIDLAECKIEDEYDENQVEFLQFFDEYDLDIDEHFMEKDFEHKLKAIHRVSQDTSKCKAVAKQEDLAFGTDGFKQRYYMKKMDIKFEEKPAELNNLVFEYVRGLCWVMLYYYQGCVSWSWYYPYHYAPFASDLQRIYRYEAHFEFDKIKSKPLSPFGQLMGVLPAVSGKIALPSQFSQLMERATSPIIDFYPTDFKLDLNGKMFNWQAVVLLPFVDAERLCAAIEPLERALTGKEKRMNSLGSTLLFVNKTHLLSRAVLPLYAHDDDDESREDTDEHKKDEDEEDAVARELKAAAVQHDKAEEEEDEKEEDEEDGDFVAHKCVIDPTLSQGINGEIESYRRSVRCGRKLVPPKNVRMLKVIENGVDVVSCHYRLPKYTRHECRLLPGLQLPEPMLDEADLENMEKGHRFGKPRFFKRRDTHFNYNRGWDTGMGHQEGAYKAKHNKNRQHELHYQPTRAEYNASHSSYYQQQQGYDSYSRQHPYQQQQQQQQQYYQKPQTKWVPKGQQQQQQARPQDNAYDAEQTGYGSQHGYYQDNARYYQQPEPRQQPQQQQWYAQRGGGGRGGGGGGYRSNYDAYYQPQQQQQQHYNRSYDQYYAPPQYQQQQQQQQQAPPQQQQYYQQRRPQDYNAYQPKNSKHYGQ